MARVLSDGKIKFTILTTAPANPAAPTAAELNAGIDLSDDVLASDFTWTPVASDTIDEKSLAAKGNATTFTYSNYDLGITLWRQFDSTTGAPDTANEAGWAALKEKGATLWGYARETGKDATEAWAASDESYLGGEILTDEPQRTDGAGFIKRRIVLGAQNMHTNITVGGV